MTAEFFHDLLGTLNSELSELKKKDLENDPKLYTDQCKYLTAQITDLKQMYIQTNRPCEIGDVVRMKLFSGGTVVGTVNAFANYLGTIYVSSYKVGSKTIFASKPQQEIIKKS